ncbi:hypothetical protein ACQPU1_13275 [Clostridium paraputrificum]|uniref:hypothetical protein n=1 Tax=Clostridium paraputrificum TaxID=29363 RepID=UPI003D34A519
MYDERPEGLGGGIITISVLHLIGVVISIIGAVVGILNKDLINKEAVKKGLEETSTGQYIAVAVIALALLVAVILILLKKAVGLYIYAGYVVVNIIYTIIASGFSILSIVLGLVLPVIMAFLVMKRKYVFGLGADEY